MNDKADDIGTDIADILDRGPWTSYQKRVLALVAAAIVLDGFDNQVLGFAIPVLVKAWGVGKEAFATVFAFGFVGMIFGTAIGGWLGDRIGRRAALILSVVIFGVATGCSALADGIPTLILCRFAAGFGLGGAMPTATALIAEFSPIARRSLAITIGIVCIPLGGVVGGLIAAQVLPTIGWRALFAMAGVLPMIVALMLVVFLPESPRFLLRGGRVAEARVVLARIAPDLPVNTRLTDSGERRDVLRKSITGLFSSGYARDTLALWLAFFACLMATYLVFSWAPVFLTGAGFSVAQSSRGLAIFNMGGVAGALLAARWMTRVGSRRSLPAIALGAAAVALVIAATSLDPARPAYAFVVLLIEGAFINATQTGLYALAAHVYPLSVRASGVGATAGLGRGGALASAFVGVTVLSGGAAGFFGAIGAAMVVTFVALLAVRRHTAPAEREIARASSPILDVAA